MSTVKQGNGFLDEFKDFLKFLQTLWGLLAGISVFFPLSNILLKIIPLHNIYDEEEGGLSFLSPTLITALATVATLFVILSTFGQRGRLWSSKQQNTTRRQAWVAFVLGFAALFVFFAIYFGIYGFFYAPLGIWGGSPLRLLGDFLILLFYSAFFALLTRAFVLLGMSEYFRKEKQ